MAPARVRVALNLEPLIRPESLTAHGPAGHFGLASQDSVHRPEPAPLRSAPPRTILMATAHGPCKRAAESGGVDVLTTSTEDRAERLPPRTAATRYR